MNDFKNLKEKFNQSGFFVCKNLFDKIFLNNIVKEISLAEDTQKYFDNNNNLRRVEKLYNKGKFLEKLNLRLIQLLKNIFEEDYIIFKDKFNAKPPGGDGFYAHYDGIFHFLDNKNIKRKGWYEYGDNFINVMLAIDLCNEENGALELSQSHTGEFEDLLKNTKNDGTPALKKEIEEKISFQLINLDPGDVVIFSHTCPHRSKKNNSKNDRRILYYTYSLRKNGSKYNQYFEDKKKSKNSVKALNEKN
tara:strand:+ start:676 stop:1419 length:744 start_codon:yes stop_codon:yes gene_type:complete